MDSQKGVRKKRRSFIGTLYDNFLLFLHTLILKSHIGQFIVSDGEIYRGSAIHKFADKRNVKLYRNMSEGARTFFSKSRVIVFFKRLTETILSMSVNVYGIFFAIYGIASAFVYYALIFLDGGKKYSFSALVFSCVILLLSVPFLTSSKSLTEIISGSVTAGRIIRSFLMIPDDMLKTKKKIGSTAHMIIFAILGLIFGALTYFTHPIVAPCIFIGLLLLLVIMSSPESGVVIIAVSLPFLQYLRKYEFILPVLVAITCVSYFFKACGGKRVGTKSVGGMILFFFCALLLISSCGAVGGIKTFASAVYAVLMIIGGFYVTYNLIKSEKKLKTLIRCITVSLGILVLMGIWDIGYNGGVYNVIKNSLGEISEAVPHGTFYFSSIASTFGIMTCAFCPVLFCEAISRKSVSGMAVSFLWLVASVAVSVIYCSYEYLMAICVGLLIYIIFHSKKSFSGLITGVLIIFICAMLVVSFVPNSITSDVYETVSDVIPSIDNGGAIDNDVDRSVWNMISDGRLCGIGVGEDAFTETFSAYSSDTVQNVVAPQNLYTQIICWSGIGGIAVFAIFIFYVLKSAVGYVLISTDKIIRRYVLALSCGLISVLILGMRVNLWADMRTFYLFWTLVALLCGYARFGRSVEDEKRLREACECDCADVSIRL